MSEWTTPNEAIHRTGLGTQTLEALADAGILLSVRVPDRNAAGGRAIKYANTSVAALEADPLITANKATARLRVSRMTFHRWTADGIITPDIEIARGKRQLRLFRAAQIDLLIRQRELTAKPVS